MGEERIGSREAPPKGSALVVDGDKETRANLRRALPAGMFRVVEATDAWEALAKLDAAPDAVELLVLDASQARPSTLEMTRRLRRGEATAHLPIFAFTWRPLSEVEVQRMVEHGVTDIVQMPASPSGLAAKLRTATEQVRFVRKLQKELVFAQKNATVDELTELGNRRGFEARVLEESAYAKRHKEPFSVLLLDLDRFKSINDRFGHDEGDRVLAHFAAALRTVTRGEDVAFRYGGDEFVLLLRACDGTRARDVAGRLRAHLHQHPFRFSDGTLAPIPFSGGVAAVLPNETFAGQDLFGRADVALYRAKNGGRDRVFVWGIDETREAPVSGRRVASRNLVTTPFTPTTLVRTLRQGRALISSEARWIPRGYAQDREGRWCPVGSESAARFSVLGALVRVGGGSRDVLALARRSFQHIAPELYEKLTNEELPFTHADAMELLDRTITRLDATVVTMRPHTADSSNRNAS
ncbi:GGDEF domain-containing protein [Pendulispora albinea]|uniref:diguanylate cyclase n=1 Tax=Pendulispora albinea TaxID=2741071 RepID=A0ABZ2M099_9BACT